MTNLLQHILVPFLGVASGVVDFGGRHADAYATASRDDKHIDAQEKINMFEIIPYTSLSHPYIGLSHPYSGPSYPSLPLCSHCKCNECMDRQDKLFEKIEAIAKAIEELKSKRGVMLSKKVSVPYTPTAVVRKKKRSIRHILSIMKLKKYNSFLSKSC